MHTFINLASLSQLPLQDLNPKTDDRIRRHPTFRTDVSDSNQSTECQPQNISSAVDYPTLGSRNSDSCSGSYPTLLCRIGVGFPTCVVAVIRHFPVGYSMSMNQTQVRYPTHKIRISDGWYRFFL